MAIQKECHETFEKALEEELLTNWDALQKHLRMLKGSIHDILSEISNLDHGSIPQSPRRRFLSIQTKLADCEHVALQIGRLQQVSTRLDHVTASAKKAIPELHISLSRISTAFCSNDGTVEIASGRAGELCVENTVQEDMKSIWTRLREVVEALEKKSQHLREDELTHFTEHDIERLLLRAWRMQLVNAEWLIQLGLERVKRREDRLKEIEVEIIRYAQDEDKSRLKELVYNALGKLKLPTAESANESGKVKSLVKRHSAQIPQDEELRIPCAPSPCGLTPKESKVLTGCTSNVIPFHDTVADLKLVSGMETESAIAPRQESIREQQEDASVVVMRNRGWNALKESGAQESIEENKNILIQGPEKMGNDKTLTGNDEKRESEKVLDQLLVTKEEPSSVKIRVEENGTPAAACNSRFEKNNTGLEVEKFGTSENETEGNGKDVGNPALRLPEEIMEGMEKRDDSLLEENGPHDIVALLVPATSAPSGRDMSVKERSSDSVTNTRESDNLENSDSVEAEDKTHYCQGPSDKDSELEVTEDELQLNKDGVEVTEGHETEHAEDIGCEACVGYTSNAKDSIVQHSGAETGFVDKVDRADNCSIGVELGQTTMLNSGEIAIVENPLESPTLEVTDGCSRKLQVLPSLQGESVRAVESSIPSSCILKSSAEEAEGERNVRNKSPLLSVMISEEDCRDTEGSAVVESGYGAMLEEVQARIEREEAPSKIESVQHDSSRTVKSVGEDAYNLESNVQASSVFAEKKLMGKPSVSNELTLAKAIDSFELTKDTREPDAEVNTMALQRSEAVLFDAPKLGDPTNCISKAEVVFASEKKENQEKMSKLDETSDTLTNTGSGVCVGAARDAPCAFQLLSEALVAVETSSEAKAEANTMNIPDSGMKTSTKDSCASLYRMSENQLEKEKGLPAVEPRVYGVEQTQPGVVADLEGSMGRRLRTESTFEDLFRVGVVKKCGVRSMKSAGNEMVALTSNELNQSMEESETTSGIGVWEKHPKVEELSIMEKVITESSDTTDDLQELTIDEKQQPINEENKKSKNKTKRVQDLISDEKCCTLKHLIELSRVLLADIMSETENESVVIEEFEDDATEEEPSFMALEKIKTLCDKHKDTRKNLETTVVQVVNQAGEYEDFLRGQSAIDVRQQTRAEEHAFPVVTGCGTPDGKRSIGCTLAKNAHKALRKENIERTEKEVNVGNLNVVEATEVPRQRHRPRCPQRCHHRRNDCAGAQRHENCGPHRIAAYPSKAESQQVDHCSRVSPACCCCLQQRLARPYLAEQKPYSTMSKAVSRCVTVSVVIPPRSRRRYFMPLLSGAGCQRLCGGVHVS